VYSGVRTVKSFGGEEKESAALALILGEAEKVSLRIGQLKSGVEAANRFAIYSTLLTIAIASGFLVMAGQLQQTRFISFIGYVYMLTFAVQGISYRLPTLAEAAELSNVCRTSSDPTRLEIHPSA